MVFQNFSSYGKEALAEDVDQLRLLNKQLEEDCVLFTKDNHLGNLKYEFAFEKFIFAHDGCIVDILDILEMFLCDQGGCRYC